MIGSLSLDVGLISSNELKSVMNVGSLWFCEAPDWLKSSTLAISTGLILLSTSLNASTNVTSGKLFSVSFKFAVVPITFGSTLVSSFNLSSSAEIDLDKSSKLKSASGTSSTLLLFISIAGVSSSLTLEINSSWIG